MGMPVDRSDDDVGQRSVAIGRRNIGPGQVQNTDVNVDESLGVANGHVGSIGRHARRHDAVVVPGLGIVNDAGFGSVGGGTGALFGIVRRRQLVAVNG